MANTLQKLIYSLSATAPLCFTFAILWATQKGTWIVPMVCLSLSILLFLFLKRFFTRSERDLAAIKIRINNLSPKDLWVMAYCITYALPFVSLAIDGLNVIIFGIIVTLIVAVIIFANSVTFNPLSLFLGYHFYEISAENGVSGYLLLSKRSLRNVNQVTKVKRVFEFLLLDTEE